MTPLTLIVITRNAGKHLGRCLGSVPFAAEKIVVDSGSTDDTIAIAKSAGARVVTEVWRGFGAQKRFATSLAKTNWVLNLDADEALSTGAQNELRTLLGEPDRLAQSEAFAFPRLSYHLGRWIRHGGWYPDWQVRLYDRRRANWDEAPIHEKVRASRIERLKSAIEHRVFESLHHQVETNNRYSGLGSERLRRDQKRFSLFNLIVKPKVKFFEVYVWKLGFLDGLPGFIIAVSAAYSVFLKWAKLWEHERGSESA